jgi:hypothetical protein
MPLFDAKAAQLSVDVTTTQFVQSVIVLLGAVVGGSTVNAEQNATSSVSALTELRKTIFAEYVTQCECGFDSGRCFNYNLDAREPSGVLDSQAPTCPPLRGENLMAAYKVS